MPGLGKSCFRDSVYETKSTVKWAGLGTEALLVLVSEFFRQLGVGLVCTMTIHLAS